MYTQDTPLAVTAPATAKQVGFLHKLVVRKLEAAQAAHAITWMENSRMSKRFASDKITELMSLPDIAAESELDEGMYRVDGEIFKVYHTRETGILVTKTLTEDGFEYTGKKPLNRIKPEHRMTLDEAKEYGKVTGTCCQCGRTLTNESSIAEGIGPVCAGKF